MTILQSLASYYDRMAARGEAEPPGFNREKISFAVVIDSTGEPVGVMDLRDSSGKRPVPTLRDVPASQKRTVAIAPNFLWDKTAYSLGVTARESKRTAQEHQAFCDLHYALLADATDEGLFALHCFLDKWAPERFSSVPFTPEMLDTNFVFQLDGDLDGRGRPRFIHERPAARSLIEERSSKGETGFCLITGTEGSIARLHPGIKGVYADSPPPGGSYSLVSFNLPAFESWGKTQGTNAPLSRQWLDPAIVFMRAKIGCQLAEALGEPETNRQPRPIGGQSQNMNAGFRMKRICTDSGGLSLRKRF